jgi:hypothetical protein
LSASSNFRFNSSLLSSLIFFMMLPICLSIELWCLAACVVSPVAICEWLAIAHTHIIQTEINCSVQQPIRDPTTNDSLHLPNN